MSKGTDKQQMDTITQLCIDLPVMEDRLRRAGLYKTAAKLNTAVKAIGYEVAEKYANKY